MRLKLANLSKTSNITYDEILPFSRTVRISRNKSASSAADSIKTRQGANKNTHRIVSTEPTTSKPPKHPPKLHDACNRIDPARPEYRENEMQIQMLSRPLYQQIFGISVRSDKPPKQLDPQTANRLRDALQSHGLRPGAGATAGQLPDIDSRLRLPPLHGRSLETHFERIADEQLRPYRLLAERLVVLETDQIPPPDEWRLQAGWTHYCAQSGRATAVPFPADDALVFDIENCVREGAAPTLACALGVSGWYSWVSKIKYSKEKR